MCRGFIGWKPTRVPQTLRPQTTCRAAQASTGIHLQPLCFCSFFHTVHHCNVSLLDLFFMFLFILNLPFASNCFYVVTHSSRGQIRILDVSRFVFFFLRGEVVTDFFPLTAFSSISWATLIIHGPHVLHTDYKHLHLTTVIIIIAAGEFYSPSCNLGFMRVRLDFGSVVRGSLFTVQSSGTNCDDWYLQSSCILTL